VIPTSNSLFYIILWMAISDFGAGLTSSMTLIIRRRTTTRKEYYSTSNRRNRSAQQNIVNHNHIGRCIIIFRLQYVNNYSCDRVRFTNALRSVSNKSDGRTSISDLSHRTTTTRTRHKLMLYSMSSCVYNYSNFRCENLIRRINNLISFLGSSHIDEII